MGVLHRVCYTKFFWNALVFYDGGVGFAETLPFFSVNYLIFWVFGGSYTLWGPVFGAMFLTILPELLRFSVYDRFIIYGVILTAMVILRPQGVITRRSLGRRPAFFALFPAPASARPMAVGESTNPGSPEGSG